MDAYSLVRDGLISRPQHLARVDDVTGAGGRVLRVRMMDGLEVDVLPERGLDIGAVWFRGRPLSWSSPISDGRPLGTAVGREWMSRFNGGLIVTCGLDNIGPATETAGQHGSFSHKLAYDITWNTEVTAEGSRVTIVGTIEDIEVLGHRLYVHRTITVAVPADGQPWVQVSDRISNEGLVPKAVSLLYHVNFGAPAVLPGTTVTVDADAAAPREMVPSVPTATVLPEVSDVMTEAVFEYSGIRAPRVVLSTPGEPRDLEITWSQETLPRLLQWVLPARGGWVLGIEPANAPIFGTDRAGEFNGAPVLAPGASFDSSVRIRVLAAS